MPTQNAFTAKEQASGDTPVFLFECTTADGAVARWSSRTVEWDDHTWDARILRHNLFEAQVASDTQVGGAPKLSFELANADSLLSEIERSTGFKGSRLLVRTLFVEAATGQASTDAVVVFRGLMNSPELITENSFRLSAMNRLTMQRTVVPDVRVQRLCPWRFPVTPEQRLEAVDGGALKGKYSPFFRCGYSPDQESGCGNSDGGSAFTSCSHTRSDCEQRGMFNRDSSGRTTARFGGIEFVPPTILVRGNGQKNYSPSSVQDNQARYNDFVPLVYGTQWHAPDVVFSRNDGNLTRMEVLLSMGEISGIRQVLVNGAEIPRGVNGLNMTATGWWNLMNAGARTGVQDPNFADGAGTPIGDPYGSMAYLSVVVPNRVNDGSSIPKVQVLMDGLRLWQFDEAGESLGESFSDNPAWVLLDVLLRGGYALDEIDAASFARAAAWCGEIIEAEDPVEGFTAIPRFQCNFALKDRRSAGEVIRAIRNSSRLYLILNATGLLEVRMENTFALQQPVKPANSNATETYEGGWPAYEFDASSIARNADGSGSVKLSTRGAQDTPNRLSVEFQDEFNQYQQDSLSLSNGDDSDLCGQEVAATWDAVGLTNFNQAARMLALGLNRGIEGNRYIEFETSVKALGLLPGDLITVSYFKESLTRTPFRIQKITPGPGFRTATIVAQYHNDEWYSDTATGVIGGRGWQAGQGTGLPAPVGGIEPDEDGVLRLAVMETDVTGSDGTLDVELSVGYSGPSELSSALAPPLLSLATTILSAGGTLAGAAILYYALSSVDAADGESMLSFAAQAVIPPGGGTNSVVLEGIALPAGVASFNVYRGTSPQQLYRIASAVPGAASFTDTGLPPQAVLPPDPRFDHVNVRWRWELLPETPVTIHSASTIGNADLELHDDSFVGSVVRITSGKGEGQERQIVSHSATTLTVDRAWTDEPSAASRFAIAENSWRLGGTATASPVPIHVPGRLGTGLHISVRAANVADDEASYELSPVARWILGQSGLLEADADVPPAPIFAIGASTARPGALELGGIGFASLVNTRTILAGTFRIHYYNELTTSAPFVLLAAPGADDTDILTDADPGAGKYLQIDSEILRVESDLAEGHLTVTRGALGTAAAAHATDASVLLLTTRIVISPFVRNFFGSPAGGDWSDSVDIPDARVAAVELFMTNLVGDGAIAVNAYTEFTNKGIRTLAGGQVSFQIAGYLAIQSGAAPDVLLDVDRSVRDIYGVLRTAPAGASVKVRIRRNGEEYAILEFADGVAAADPVPGIGLAALRTDDRLSFDITAVGSTNPGADLTVVIRL